jgi:hypothetical protein
VTRALTQASDDAHDPNMSDRAHDFVPRPDVSAVVTEVDEPVDNWPSEKQQRVLVDALYASWDGPPPDVDADPPETRRSFVAGANIGVFATPRDTPIVPDVLVGVDVALQEPPWQKEHRAYFVWEMGAPPAITIEIVSNREGDELTRKKARYGRMRVSSYVVFDPQRLLGEQTLHVFRLAGDVLVPVRRDGDVTPLGELGLAVRTWDGELDGLRGHWLRFCREDGALLATGRERAEAERQRTEAEKQRADAEQHRADAERHRADAEQHRADTEKQRADAEQHRADAERHRANALAERLRRLGVDPES